MASHLCNSCKHSCFAIFLLTQKRSSRLFSQSRLDEMWLFSIILKGFVLISFLSTTHAETANRPRHAHRSEAAGGQTIIPLTTTFNEVLLQKNVWVLSFTQLAISAPRAFWLSMMCFTWRLLPSGSCLSKTSARRIHLSKTDFITAAERPAARGLTVSKTTPPIHATSRPRLYRWSPFPLQSTSALTKTHVAGMEQVYNIFGFFIYSLFLFNFAFFIIFFNCMTSSFGAVFFSFH